MTIRVAELCAGYGGLFLATQAAGWPTELAWYAENDPDASAVMAGHHPGVKNHGDITTADWSKVEPVDVLAAGYPCQSFSNAGLRKGFDDDRAVWPHVARAVRHLRPRVVLLENVSGHLARGFGRVLGDLADLGFVGSWMCVRASDIGAPHRRERVFVIAHPADAAPDSSDSLYPQLEPVPVTQRGRTPVAGDDREGPRHLIPTPAARLGDGRGQPSAALAAARGTRRRNLDDAVALLPTPAARDAGRGTGWGEQPGRPLSETIVRLMPTPTVADSRNATAGRSDDGQAHNGWTLCDVAHADRWGQYGAAISRWETVTGRDAPAPTVRGVRGGERLSPLFVEWLMGLPAGYVTDHLDRNAALRVLGNGVVPPQAALAFRALVSQRRRKP